MAYSLIVTLAGIFAASVLRGFTGFGFGLAAVPLLSLVLPPAQVVPLVVTLQVIIGIAGLRSALNICDWRTIWLLVPGLLAGIPLGLITLTALPADPVRLVIGGIILGSVLLISSGARLPSRPSRLIGSSVGLVSGFINGLASMGGPPVVVYMLAIGHSTVRMRATTIVYFMLSSCLSLVPMTIRGLITRDILIWAAIALPVLFGGSRLGTWAFHHARPQHHRLTALISLTILGSTLIIRALVG